MIYHHAIIICDYVQSCPPFSCTRTSFGISLCSSGSACAPAAAAVCRRVTRAAVGTSNQIRPMALPVHPQKFPTTRRGRIQTRKGSAEQSRYVAGSARRRLTRVARHKFE
jgi:hypothetical protein